MSRILTLNIGASKATLAEYTLSGKRNLTLTAYGSGDLQTVDVGDALSVSASLPPILSQMMRETGIRPAPLAVSLGGQMVFPRFAKFPAVGDAAKMEQLVQYEVEQNVPFPIDEIVCDHQFIGTTPEGDRAAMIVAAKLDAVRAVTDAVVAAGLRPEAVDVSPMAVLNALRFANPGLSGCNIVLDIGAKTTNLILVEDEKVYNRSIPVAGNTITKDIAQAFGCSTEEAERLKIERGYVSLGGVTEDEDEISDRVSKVIRTTLTRLHAEISRSINFYRSQQGGSAPVRLFLTGGTVRLPQLDEFFRESLQLDVGYLNPFTSVGVGGKVDASALESDAFVLAESVGLALRHTDAPGLVRINLMPPELVAQARNVRRIPFLAAGAAGLLAALGFGILVQNRGLAESQAQLACVEAENARLGQMQQRLQTAQTKEKAALAACDSLQKLMRRRTLALDRVNAVRESLRPLPGMWISKWESKKAGGEEDAPEEVNVVVLGWNDRMENELGRWRKDNPRSRNVDAPSIIRENLAKSDLVAKSDKGGHDAVAVSLQTGPSLQEVTLSFKFAPVPSADPDASAAKKSQKRGTRK